MCYLNYLKSREHNQSAQGWNLKEKEKKLYVNVSEKFFICELLSK